MEVIAAGGRFEFSPLLVSTTIGVVLPSTVSVPASGAAVTAGIVSVIISVISGGGCGVLLIS